MATSPRRVRSALLRVTGGARAELRAVARRAAEEPAQFRAALFAAAPLIVSEYAPGASTLALDWYEEIREEAAPRRLFTPTPRLNVTDEDVAAVVARTTEALRDFDRGDFEKEFAAEAEKFMAESMRQIESEVQQAVANAFRDTVIENTKDDPDAVGWRRFARPEACKFCLMLAARGAVYTEATARFAAHGANGRDGRKGGDCMCIAGPAFGGQEIWAEATPMQYVASRKTRTPERRAELREYLNHNFPDAPG